MGDDDVTWIRIVSWHAVRTPTRVPRRYVTRCGRSADGTTFDQRPDGKSCETCLRIVTKGL